MNFLVNKVLVDIFNGYSESKLENSSVFIKHFNHFDQLAIDEIKENKLKEAIARGLPLENDKLRDLKLCKIWTAKDDEEILEARINRDGLQKSRSKMFVPSQIKEYDVQIKEWSDKLDAKLRYKEELIGLTAEKFAERAANNEYIVRSMYKDRCLSELYFNDFNNTEDEELVLLFNTFSDGMAHLDNSNIKRAAISITFQNLLSINDNGYYLMGRWIKDWSFYQVTLISWGNYYKNIISQLGSEMTEEMREDPEKLESLFITSQNKKVERAKRGNNTEFFGDVEPNEKLYREAEMLQKGFSSIEAVNQYI